MVRKIDKYNTVRSFTKFGLCRSHLFIVMKTFEKFLILYYKTPWKSLEVTCHFNYWIWNIKISSILLIILILFSNNTFPISWRIFARPLRDLLDKPRKRNRCESLKKLIMDKICDFVNELSAFWEFASSRIVEIGCQIPNNVSLVSFALIKSIPLYVQFLIRTLNAVATL